MEDSKQLENTGRIFATTLVHCVIRKDFPNWIPKAAIGDVDIFSEFMQTEIENICQLNSSLFWWEFLQSFAGKEKTAVTFNKFCSCMSSIIEHQEIKLEMFLKYAATLAKISTFIYEDVVEAPYIAVRHITDVLVTRYSCLLRKKPSEK
ncbi:hypothetical protein TNCT_402971 [Trichonephila clavata]|uniref:Uncharacterized protein n=1 Tax=Trichonephila clavata TaxID=2740835 RepID=A0A8X6KKI6_TRICU|nr:hypothetical protein TNCT_402971 [Trichonephila clavata]